MIDSSPKRAAIGGRSPFTGRWPARFRSSPMWSFDPPRPSRSPRSPRACSIARVPLTVAGGRSGVCGAAVPVFGGVVLDTTVLAGRRRRSTTPPASSRSGRAPSGPTSSARFRTSTACRSATCRRASTSRPSAAGSRAAAPASTRPGTARSKTWSSVSTSCWPTAPSSRTGGAPAARPPAPTSPSCSSARRARSASSPGLAADSPRAGARASRGLRVRLVR